MMEFLRANSIWDSILLLFPFDTFDLRCLRFMYHPQIYIQVMSKRASEWLCTRSNGQAIHNSVLYIDIELNWIGLDEPYQASKNWTFAVARHFFPAMFFLLHSVFTSFSILCCVCALSLLILVVIGAHVLFLCCFCLVLFCRLRSFFFHHHIVNRSFRNCEAKTTTTTKEWRNRERAIERKENGFGAGKQTYF